MKKKTMSYASELSEVIKKNGFKKKKNNNSFAY